jgi:hypothetical protein
MAVVAATASSIPPDAVNAGPARPGNDDRQLPRAGKAREDERLASCVPGTCWRMATEPASSGLSVASFRREKGRLHRAASNNGSAPVRIASRRIQLELASTALRLTRSTPRPMRSSLVDGEFRIEPPHQARILSERTPRGIVSADSTPSGRPSFQTVLSANLRQGDRSLLESAGA